MHVQRDGDDLSNRDCVGVQWIKPCINGSGRLLAWDFFRWALWTLNPSGVSGSIPLSERSSHSERKCKWNETRIFDWEVHLTHPPKPDQEKCLVRANRKRPVLSSSMHSRGKFVWSRWLGRRPIVRGVAMNPVDQPHGSVRGFMLINRILVIISVGSKLLPD